MRHKYRLETAIKFFQLAFYPKTTIMACVWLGVLFDAILGIAMYLTDSTFLHELFFALLTGVTASFIVSIIVALSSNYRSNKLAWYELREYHDAVLNYELKLRTFPKSHYNYDTIYKNPDDITATWVALPTIIPILDDVLKTKKEFLADSEINSLKRIMTEYGIIKYELRNIIEHTIIYNSLNHPDESYYEKEWPHNIWEDMPESVRRHIIFNRSRKDNERLIDEVLCDEYLLRYYVKDYDISHKAIDAYSPKEDSSLEDTNGNCLTGDYEFEDESDMDEEQFKTYNEHINSLMMEENKPFISWTLSSCSLIISKEIAVLKKVIKKKPYVGTMLKLSETIENE